MFQKKEKDKSKVEKDKGKEKKNGFFRFTRRSKSEAHIEKQQIFTPSIANLSAVHSKSDSSLLYSDFVTQEKAKGFFKAAIGRNAKQILSYLTPEPGASCNPIDVNLVNANGETALFFAAGNADAEAIDILLRSGASVNAISFTGISVIHNAAGAGNHVLLAKLVEKALPEVITSRDWDGNTPLHFAAGHANDKCMQILIENINTKNYGGFTPLGYCVANQHTASNVKFLLEKGAKPNRGESPLHLAAVKDVNMDIVKLLVDNGAKIKGCRKCKVGVACNYASQTSLDAIHSLLKERKQKSGKGQQLSAAKVLTAADINEFLQGIKQNRYKFVKNFCKNFHLDSVEEMPITDSMKQEGKTLLHMACSEGAVDVANYFIRKGASVDATSNRKWTPLHEACYEGHLHVCDLLLSKGANPNSLTDEGILPFHYFVLHNYSKKTDVDEMFIFHRVFEQLSAHGENVNVLTRVRNESPLHYACLRMEAEENVKLLLQLKSNVNIVDKRGNTALHISVINKRKTIIKLLLDAGANPTLASKAGDCFTLAKGDQEIISLLTPPNAETTTNTPLLHAMKQGDLQAIKLEASRLNEIGMSLEEVPPPPAYAEDGRSWLHIVAAEGHLEVLKYLLNNNHIEMNAKSSTGWTALHEAANSGHLFILDELLQFGFDPTIATNEGNLPLHYFACHSYTASQDDFVSMYKFLRVFDRLTGSKTLLNAQNTLRKETPLHYACKKADTKTNVLLLMKDGADPNIKDKKGNTPLHVAIQYQRVELVKVLLEFGADINAMCGNKTCFELAGNNSRILQVLNSVKDRLQEGVN